GECLRCRISLHPQKSLYAAPVRTLVGLESARKFVLQNAVFHGGKADAKAVLGRMLAEDASLRGRAQEVADHVERVVADVNRIPLHYEWAEKLLSTGEAYVCECDAETLRKNREAMKACVHRIQSVDETIAMWKAMLAGEYAEGEAVVRLKTDMADPNPAFRD